MKLDIKDNAIIICENDYKECLLKKFSSNKLFLNVKFYTKKSFFENYFYKYKDNTLLYLINKYGFKVDIAKMYLEKLYYIDENKTYFHEKLQRLVDIKNELIINNYLIYNEQFKDYLSNKKIYVLGYPYLNNHEIKVFSLYDVEYESFNINCNHKNIYVFENVEKEIDYVFKKICKLVESGISLNKIKLVNVPKEYYNTLDMLASFYKLPVNMPSQTSLYSLKITKEFLNNYDSDINKTISALQGYDSIYLNKILNICNKYAYTDDYLAVKELIIDDLKNEKIDYSRKRESIDIVDLTYPFDEDDYVFVMNFNMGSIPSFIKDEDYITDNVKDEVNLKTVSEINKEIKGYSIKKLQSIKNLSLSYVKSMKGTEVYPSSLIKDMFLYEVLYQENDMESYSKIYSKINYARDLDLYHKYGTITNKLALYGNTFPDFLYRRFDNRFKGIDTNILFKHLNNNLTLSYTSLDTYYRCSFRYYLNNILKLNDYTDSFEAFIGSLFHDVLEKCLELHTSVEDEIQKYIQEKGRIIIPKERFFINKITDDINFAIDVINKQRNNISLDSEIHEKMVSIAKDASIKVNFIGFIDKILYKKYGDKTIISIIDYKTGNAYSDLKYLPYGMGMQLPIYVYLVYKGRLFENPEVAGFYLQYILGKSINIDAKKDYIKQKEDNLKLSGYSNKDIDILEKFDRSYEDSTLISGMKTKNDGNFSAYAKVLSNEQINNIVDLIDKKIDEAISNILAGNFCINPKKIGYDKEIGCQYCKYKDICFKTEKDEIRYEEINDLSFLGGDNNA